MMLPPSVVALPFKLIFFVVTLHIILNRRDDPG
jgi:flagellar biosynthesis protein FliP